MKEAIKEIHVVGAAIINECKVLAAKRSAEMSSPLKWEFAGGKVETGESHEAALVRELQEELGVEIRVRDFLATGSFDFIDKRIFLHVYEAELLKGVPYAREHAELKWVEIGRIDELDWADADIPACRELVKRHAGRQ